MNVITRSIGAALFGVAIAWGTGLASAAAQTVIRYSPWLPAKHAVHEGLIRPWIKEVERVTERRVTVEFLPKAVGTPATQFDVVRDGLADMGVLCLRWASCRCFPAMRR